MSVADLTSVLENKSFNLISDPEGYSLSHLLNRQANLATEEKPLIVLGDLLDSTIALTTNGNILKMGDLKNLKSHNLDNLIHIQENQNILLLFGNRDLNKLKVLPLTKVKAVRNRQKPTTFGRDFLEYMNPTHGKSYYDLAKILSKHVSDDKDWEWEIPNLKYWIPFWKPYDPSKSTDPVYKLWQDGSYSTQTPMSCLDRFFLIFGADNNDGTMSAYNLLYCIPREVLGDTFSEKFPTFSTTTELNLRSYANKFPGQPDSILPIKKIKNQKLQQELELAAALVLTVFTRLFIPKNIEKTNNIYEGRPLKYDGLLYDLYMNERTYFCAHATLNDTLIAFSHGGLTKKFVDSAYKEKVDAFFMNDTYYQKLTDPFTKRGGYHAVVNDSTSSKDIIKCIEEYNNESKALLKKVVNSYLYSIKYVSSSSNWAWNIEKKRKSPEDYKKPTKELVKLMAMTAPVDSCSTPIKVAEGCTNTYAHIHTGQYSPIMPGIIGPIGISGLRDPNLTLHCGDKKFIQFIGHVPHGFGASIDLITKNNNDHSTYNINLDISNTGMTHDLVSDIGSLDKNYFFMTYQKNGGLNTHGELHMNGVFDSFKEMEKKEGDNNLVIKFNTEYDLLSDKFKNHLIQKMNDYKQSIESSFTTTTTEDDKKKARAVQKFEHGQLINSKFLYSILSKPFYYDAKVHTGGSRHKKKVITRKNKLKKNKTKKNKRQ